MNLITGKAVGYFSDAELSEVKKVIEQKLEKAKKQFHFYQEQVFDFSEMMEMEQPEWGDTNLIQKDIDLLGELAQKQIHNIEKLEAAKRKIRRGVFGICEETGELIDKQRLLADPGITSNLVDEVQLTEQLFEDMFFDFSVQQEGNSDLEIEQSEHENFVSLDEIADEYGFEEAYNV